MDSTSKGRARQAHQLPPGRHGFSPEEVAQSQRARMLDAVLDAVAEKGYSEMRVTDVIARAGVSRKTFYEHFDDKEECFLAAFDFQLGALTDLTAEAFTSAAERSWPEQVRSGVAALLGYMAEHPAAARACLVDAVGAGQRAIAKRDAALRNFTYFVDAGRGAAKHEVPGRTALAVIGGVNELIASELIHGSPKNLPALAPDLVYMITLPFLGPARAFKERGKTRG